MTIIVEQISSCGMPGAEASFPTDTEVWCYQVYSPVIPNVVVDISDVAERKAAAVRMWKSQMKVRKFDHYILGFNAFNIRLLPKALYVEAFFVVPMHEYAELCAIYFNNPECGFLQSCIQVRRDDRPAAGTANSK